MAGIDKFIRVLFEEDGDRLAIVSERPVSLLRDGEEREITERTPSPEAVDRLLREIVPPGQADGGDSKGRFEFTYDAPSGRVTVRAYRSQGTVRIGIVPTPGEAGEAAVPESGAGRDASAAPGPGDRSTASAAAGEAGAAVEGAGGGAATADGAAEVAAGQEGGPPMPSPPPEPDAPALHRLLLRAVEADCSDLHFCAGEAPLFRKDGEIVDLGGERAYSPEETREMLLELTPERNRREFEETHDTDFGYAIEGRARFRVNLYMDRKGMSGAFRHIPDEIMTVEEIGLSDHILELCQRRKGLVIVTGPTGSGKSTTLAAMLDYINKTRREHIVTIEDPIEYTHENKKCLVNQREVGIHTESFAVALRATLREDPDVVLVGELRDLETTQIALRTAETGHLVFGTLHTNTAASTVDRIIDQYPEGQQGQIRTMLADTLKGVIAQTLCKRKQGGRVAALEVLLVTPAVSNLIREEKTFQIPTVIQTSSEEGMKTLNQALIELVEEGVVHVNEAYRHAVNKDDFAQALDRKGLETDFQPQDVVVR